MKTTQTILAGLTWVSFLSYLMILACWLTDYNANDSYTSAMHYIFPAFMMSISALALTVHKWGDQTS